MTTGDGQYDGLEVGWPARDMCKLCGAQRRCAMVATRRGAYRMRWLAFQSLLTSVNTHATTLKVLGLEDGKVFRISGMRESSPKWLRWHRVDG